MTQYARQASVIIGTPGSGGLSVTDLRISFTVGKTEGKEPNKATIEIFNMSEKSRNLIKEPGELVYLSAGYKEGNGLENLFIGNIISINHKFERPDVVTVIEANDGAEAIRETKISLSFVAGTSADVVLEKILKSFLIGSDISTLAYEDVSYANGFSFVGASDVALDKVTKFMGLTWSIQNNEIRFTRFDESNGSRVVQITPETGMIGSPERLQGVTRKSKGVSKKTKPGWRVRTLLSPRVIPSGKIELGSREIPEKSVFKVISVDHSGDTQNSDWISNIEVREE